MNDTQTYIVVIDGQGVPITNISLSAKTVRSMSSEQRKP